MSGVVVTDIGIQEQLRIKADTVAAEFQRRDKKRGYDPAYWMRFLSIVFNILWKERKFDRIFLLDQMCGRYLNAKRDDKQVFLNAIHATFEDLCLMAEYVEKHPANEK